jgi:hypothetical protein
MKIEELNTFIIDYIQGRFQLQESTLSVLLCLDETSIAKKVLRIQRIKQDNITYHENWKTILIAEVHTKEEIQFAQEWSAIVKDALLDPETADLYLFIIYAPNVFDISIDECNSIESSEQYCRKYIQRPGKTAIELIERTFLSKLEDIQQQNDVIDPINTAIAATAEKHSWFTDEEQKKWRTALLSENSGYDLIELLFSKTQN